MIISFGKYGGCSGLKIKVININLSTFKFVKIIRVQYTLDKILNIFNIFVKSFLSNIILIIFILITHKLLVQILIEINKHFQKILLNQQFIFKSVRYNFFK